LASNQRLHNMLQRKKYTREFKIKAIELAELKQDVPSVAEDLGVSRSMIYRWKREMDKGQQTCFPGNGQVNLSDQERELKRLQNELNEVRMERDILKKAISIFSKTDRKYSGS
jgi:transposase